MRVLGDSVGMCTATLLADPMAAGEAEVRAAAEAALAAGFRTSSVWAQHLGALEGLDLRPVAVEAAFGWANGTAGEAAEEADRIVGAAARVGASRIVAVCMEPAMPDPARARDNLALLVERAAEVGAQACVEFLPWSGIPDLATAWDLVAPLGPAAGILLDTWHWVRQPGGPAHDVLASIPGERIGYVQLCDAAPAPAEDLFTEAMTGRLLPGAGIVDFADLFRRLDAIGASPFVATEIFNTALVSERGARGAAAAMAESVSALGL